MGVSTASARIKPRFDQCTLELDGQHFGWLGAKEDTALLAGFGKGEGKSGAPRADDSQQIRRLDVVKKQWKEPLMLPVEKRSD